MRSLIDFLIKYSKWFVCLFYVLVSCILLFETNPYQHYVFLTSANRVSAACLSFSANVTSYFHLHDINEDLQLRNASLEMEVTQLRRQLRRLREDLKEESLRSDSIAPQFDFQLAHVISNSVSRTHN